MMRKVLNTSVAIIALLFIATTNAYALPPQPGQPGGPGLQGQPNQPQNPNPPSQPSHPAFPTSAPTITPAPVGGVATPMPTATPESNQTTTSTQSNNSSNSSDHNGAGGQVLALSDTGSNSEQLLSVVGLVFSYAGLNIMRRRGRK